MKLMILLLVMSRTHVASHFLDPYISFSNAVIVISAIEHTDGRLLVDK